MIYKNIKWLLLIDLVVISFTFYILLNEQDLQESAVYDISSGFYVFFLSLSNYYLECNFNTHGKKLSSLTYLSYKYKLP